MKFKFQLLLLFGFLLCKQMVAQDPNPNSIAKITDVLPPGPNAAALGKYGGLNVGLHTGQLSKNIPLYTFKYREMELPISINYSTSGFKPDEIASRVGLGWTLNAGGVITRTVHDKPDDINMRAIKPASLGQNRASYDYYRSITYGAYDSEPDMFSFNFNGYTGQFVLDEALNPIQISVSNLKIEKDFSSGAAWKFKITAPDGVKYFFGGATATEKTKKESTCGKSYDSPVATAWYLIKIENTSGDFIQFNYEPLNLFYFNGSLIETQYSNSKYNFLQECSGTSGYPSKQCQTFFNTLCADLLRSESVILKSITTTDGGQIDLIWGNRQDYGAERLLTKLVVKDFSGVDKFIYSFLYQQVTSSNFPSSLENSIVRPFLVSVSELSTNNLNKKVHKFSYNDLSNLPVQLTMSKDHWGYYNGKSNNTLVPQHPDFEIQGRFPSAGANREPDPVYAQKGILSKIEYPTGGWEEINYESNKYFGTKTIYPPPVNVQRSVTGAGNDPSVTLVGSNSSLFTINYNHYAKLSFTITKNTTQPITNKPGGKVWIYEENGTIVYESSFYAETITRTENEIWLQAGKKYYLRVEATGSIFTTTATLTYRQAPYQSAPQNIDFGGVRVARIKAYDGSGNTPEIKRYYYSKLSSIDTSSAAPFVVPQYYKTFNARKGCMLTSSSVWNYQYCAYAAMYSSPVNFTNYYPNQANYETVVEGLGENFENGAIEHKYRLVQNNPPALVNELGNHLPMASYSNTGRYSGKELVQTFYQKSSLGAMIKVKEIEYHYNDDDRRKSFIYAFVVNQKYPVLYEVQQVDNYMMESFDVVTYTIGSNWEYLDSTVETTYDLNGSNPMVVHTTFAYDNPNHLQLTSKATKNSKGEWVGIGNRYASDFGSIAATDAVSLGIKGLQDKGIIAPVIESLSFKKSNDGTNYRVTDGRFTTYHSAIPRPAQIYQLETAAPIANLIASNSVPGQVTLDPNYKVQVSMDDYDSKNNIVQQNEKNNLIHSYQWGYNKQYPVAHVVNAKRNESFFHSFEEGGWDAGMTAYDNTKARTGKYSGRLFNSTTSKVYSMSNTWLNVNLTKPTRYKYSCWYFSTGPTVDLYLFMKRAGEPGYYTYITYYTGTQTNKWSFIEGEYTVPADVTQLNVRLDVNFNGTIWFDDVRLHPAEAQMTTYTFEPLVGMTSQTDLNNKTAYYEYDGFGRLSLVRDDKGNVLKKYCYNYAGQVTDCGVPIYTSTRSGTFTKQCADGGVGTSHSYTATKTSLVSQADADNLAQADVNLNGQNNANSIGSCTWTNDVRSGSFTKQCTNGGSGSQHTYTVAAGTLSSTISKADANQKAQDLVAANGQNNANSIGTCTWYNDAQSSTFYKQCVDGGTGSAVVYSVAAGSYSSTISKADANSKAAAAISQNGQSYANQNGGCTWYNDAQSGSFTKQCSTGGVGSTHSYSIAANTYSSSISKADANQKAINALNTSGQSNANSIGTCTFSSIAKSGGFQKNNCASGGTGSWVTYTVSAGSYTSTISQSDADAKAQNDVNANGQTYANSNGYCTWYSIAKSGSFQKNNCPSGGIGSFVTYTVAAGAYSSTISQADADSKAQNDVNSNGQAYANNNGNCTFYNIQKSGSFTRNNCPSGYTPSTVTYIVVAGKHSSTISQVDADTKAQNDVNANGQAYANANGSCTYQCNAFTCSTQGYKCINGNCQIGAKVYTGSTYNPYTGRWDCTYHYEWSDGSWSQDYVEDSYSECLTW